MRRWGSGGWACFSPRDSNSAAGSTRCSCSAPWGRATECCRRRRNERGHPLPTLPHQLASLAARRGRARKKEWPALKSPPLANRRFALRRGREMLEMRAYSSPAPCGPEGPRADGGGPGWGWPLTKKGRPEGRPKFWEETPNGRRVARRDRDNAVHNIGVIPPGFKKDFPFLLRRIICRRVLLLRCNIPTKIRHI